MKYFAVNITNVDDYCWKGSWGACESFTLLQRPQFLVLQTAAFSTLDYR